MWGADTITFIVSPLGYNGFRVKLAVLFSSVSLCVAAQTQPPAVVYECPPSDVEVFGLNCSEDQPCPVFLELAAVEALGNRVFVTGNLHTRETTLFSLLLASEDGGITWAEPAARLRNAALEQIEFVDPLTGWISGESIDPLARNPFLMMTTDGGRTWRQKPLFDDTKYGSIAQFHFDSKANGELVLDASQGRTTRQELYASMTGGESWEVKQVSNKPLKLKSSRSAEQMGWRVRADAPSGTYRLERGGGRNWESVANFPVHAADCR